MPSDLRFPRINSIVLSGRLTRDVDVRYTPSGAPVANFRLAFDRVYKDNNGEFQKVPGFIDVVAWSRLADSCASQLTKGSPVIVEGTLQTRSYENKEGRNVSVVEINASRVHFLEWKDGAPRGGGEQYGGRNNEESEMHPDVTDDDVPF